MLHALPITNVRLQPCAVAADKLTSVPGGHFCADCQRVVHDFTNATQLELAAARAASPDGRLCGRFRQAQLAAAPRLRPRLRCFLAALVLVVVQGLSAQQAWAQVRQRPAAPRTQQPTSANQHNSAKQAHHVPLSAKAQQEQLVFVGMEQMPEFKGGQKALLEYLRNNIHYPRTAASGRVFISFIVAKTGAVKDARVVKSADPALDAEALRVVKQMPNWIPAHRNGRPIEVTYTVPITFDSKQ
ncbi:energy transducer TonB [Hymenobacter latericus]|uniref:energy transducer TonB n=1 Tax=Hymenobacter sp. YIM 151858-1 TaxID=2987688 RepID=UPI002225F544|nr:energy transducer TonB [Hymenobacter sp. YIM 151858-1]UYZ58133.1 energy transducer TonB [Hymenobacter sp. YIM 151858-1]